MSERVAQSPRVVAIDGAAGSGKSTLARRLAHALRLPYVNTGLMYRALAAAAIREATSPDDEPRAPRPHAGVAIHRSRGSPR